MDKPPKQRIYEFGEFRLDAEHLMLSRGSSELALAPKAVETLLALVERRGRIVSKDELLETVWPDSIVEESNLFLYLSVLRKTLGEQPGGQPWVETLRRRGYRFTGDVKLLPQPPNGNGSADIGPVPIFHFSPSDAEAVTESTSYPNLVEPKPSRTPLLPRRVTPSLAFAFFGLAAAIVVVGIGYFYFVSRQPIRSIAVMPFASEIGNDDLDSVSEGMTYGIIGSLSEIPDLEVKAGTAMMRFKGKDVGPAAIGKELNVQSVLYPRLIFQGDNVRLYLELVDPNTENVLWHKTYDTAKSQINLVQRDIIRDVTKGLRLDLSDAVKQRIAHNYTESAEATRLYWQGTFLIRKLDQAKIRQGIGYLRQAIEQDQTYAPAYAMIANGIYSLTLCCDVHPSEMIEAKAAAARALELDENLAEAHSALAAGLFFYDWNFAEAEKHYRRALELDPNSATAHSQYADFLARSEKRNESMAERKRALDLDPFSPFFNAFALNAGDPNTALERTRFTIDLDPNFYFSHLMASGVYQRMKQYPEAIAENRRAKELAPEQTWTDVNLARIFREMGDSAQERGILEELLRRSESRYVPPFHIAMIYKGLGDREQALAWLEKAYQVRDPKMTFLKTTGWNAFENDPRFQAIYRGVGF